jgi:hypothetical protein
MKGNSFASFVYFVVKEQDRNYHEEREGHEGREEEWERMEHVLSPPPKVVCRNRRKSVVPDSRVSCVPSIQKKFADTRRWARIRYITSVPCWTLPMPVPAGANR